MSNVTTGDLSGSLSDDPNKKGGLLGRFSAKLQDAVQQGRADDPTRRPVENLAKEAALPADDMAIRQGQTIVLQRMIVPEGVVIEGTMSSNSDTQVAGRIDGDVRVEARLALEPTGIVKGKIHAAACSVRGKVHGDIEALQDLTVGETGLIQSDAIAGKDMMIAGEVNGNVKCGGRLRLTSTARLTGNIRARTLVLDDGAIFNGSCSMTKPAPLQGDPKKS
jgi:cytoskeletal protein CcmA (bactofilin family)